MAALNPYIAFRDNARTALEFYHAVLGGELTVNDFTGFPDMGIDPDEAHLVMHGQLTTPEGLTLMASDSPRAMGGVYEPPQGVSVSLSGDDEEYLQRVWDGLVDGGSVTVPFEAPPWGGRFGMLTDRFGIPWMIAVDAAAPDPAQ